MTKPIPVRTRRELVRKVGAGATLAWTTPVIVTSLTAPAAAVSADVDASIGSFPVLLAQANVDADNDCAAPVGAGALAINWVPGTTVGLAGNAAGTNDIFVDEVAVVTVSCPPDVTEVVAFNSFETDCADLMGLTPTQVSTARGTVGPPRDLTGLFAGEGIYTVTVETYNNNTPYGWDDFWLIVS